MLPLLMFRAPLAKANLPRLSPGVVAPRFYSGQPTASEEATRANHNKDDAATLADKTVKQRVQEGHARPDKVTSSPNSEPTASEDIAHGDRHDKTPEQLQKETTEKMA